MTAFQLLMHELARGGGVTTYAILKRRHGDEYTVDDFAHAVYRARVRGLVTKERGKGKPIVATGACPCCGRSLKR